MSINVGKIVGNKYRKIVNFSKAVLWKDRQISLSPTVVDRFDGMVEFVEFEDRKKGEVWIAPLENVKKRWIFKKEGQEPQYYIPIEIFKIYKGSDYLSYKSGVKRAKWNKQKYEEKERVRAIRISEQLNLI